MNSIMLDLETMSTSGNAAIIAIGAVRFNYREGITDKFYEIVDLQSSIDAGLKIDGDTVMWWMQQSDEARGEFSKKRMSLAKALQKFSGWVGNDALMWGNGASFDNAVLSNAYRSLQLIQPWKFWNDRCYRTIKSLTPEIKIERKGTHHNAVDDAETQARHLINIFNRTKP